MKLFSAAFLFALLFTVNSFSQDPPDIEQKIEGLLQKREITKLADELAKRSSDTTEDLLIKLSVFARAGHRGRVHKTLEEIGRIYPSSPDKNQILGVAKKAIDPDDFIAQKIYYENIAVNGDDGINNFIRLWLEKDADELENWLKIRAEQSEIWWREWIKLRQRSGTADEIYDDLERQVRANPGNFALVEKYLLALQYYIHTSVGGSFIHYFRDVSWLADVVKIDSASNAYRIALALVHSNTPLAETFFKKSLSLPFTAKDSEWMSGRIAKPFESKVNPEKQLRFQTKKALLEIYRKNNQNSLAESLSKEIDEMDKSDIKTDYHQLFTGYREIDLASLGLSPQEIKIYVEAENSTNIWFEKIARFEIQEDYESVRQTYLKAFETFKYAPNDSKQNLPRLKMLRMFSSFGGDHKKRRNQSFSKKGIS